jgi:hypothetical protein
VNGAVLLHIAAVFNYYLTPVATKGGAGTNVNVPANHNIAGYRGIGMNESAAVNNRLVAVEFKNVCHWLIFILSEK